MTGDDDTPSVGVGHDHSLEFGASLRRLRTIAGLTQEELAQRAGLGVRTIRDLEHGQVSRPRHSSVQLLADALSLRGRQRHAFMLAARRVGAGGFSRPDTPVASPVSMHTARGSGSA